ncbi:MAG: hypothetical protein FWC86_05520 [Coriobacteriia bacterium]|nr:hypothetical protein [Coriobacteriia bacterium]
MHKQEVNVQAANAQEANTQNKKFITITSHGITVKVNRDKFNDLELFDMIDEIQSGNVFKMPKLMRLIFEDQHDLVMDGLRNEEGIVTADSASEFLVEVLGQIGPNS